jgi:hypothetical protein
MQSSNPAVLRLKRFGAAGFAFFLLKGIAWLVAGAAVIDNLA